MATAKEYADGKISQEVIDRNSAIEQKADKIMAYVGEDYVNEETGESYSLASYIDVLADEINQKVSSDYVDDALTEYTKTSEFTIAPTMIRTEVSNVRTDLSGDISNLSSRVTQTETDITTLFESVDEGGTSTTYIREDATGITVGKVNDPYTAKVLSSGGFGVYNSTSNIYRYLVDDNGTYLYDENGDVRATITSSAGFVAGQTSAYNTQVTDNGLYLRYGNTTLGSFTATSPTDSTITLGSAGSSNYYQVINSEGDAIYNASGYPLQISGANGVAFYDGTGAASNSTQTVLLNDSSLRIGKVNNSHVIVTDQGVVISDGTDDLATYASDTITLGKSGSSQQQLTSEGNILLNNNKRTASFTSSGVNFYGSDGTTITSSFNNTGAVIGLESSFHTTTTNSDITFFNGNTVLGQYTGNSIVLGNANTTGTYQTISSAGNVISNSSGYIVQSTTSSGVNFYDGTGNSDSHITASYNSNGARIGKSSNYHVSVTESGILLENGNTTLSSFGENIVLGEETGVHQIFTSNGSSLVYGDLNNNGRVLVSYSADGMVFYDTNGNETASYTANGAIFGNRNGHHLIITEQYGIQEYYGNTLLNTSNNTSGTTYSENKNFRLGTNSNFIYFDSNTGQIYIQGSGIHFVSSSNKTIDDLLTDIDITTTPVAGGTQVSIGSNSFTVLNGQDGDDGTSISILGSYNSLAELQAAHPTATQGDSYTINGELYT